MSDIEAAGGWTGIIGRVARGADLGEAEAGAAMSSILSGEATAAQIAGFVVALRAKGETAAELSGLLDAVLAAAEAVPLTARERATAIDVVGTGGDGSHSINVSTMAAIVVAAAGTPVCKHGNRSASSMAGTADVLELLGVSIELTGAGVAECVRRAGIGFCFAPAFHPAFRFAGPPRRELGIPTVFNLLGPMANPGRVQRQLIGVADPKYLRPMAVALCKRGLTDAWVVHGDGLDELTTTGPSTVIRLREGEIDEFTVRSEDVGIPSARLAELRGGSPADNTRAVRRVLDGATGPHRDIAVLNAAAALVVAGRSADLASAVGLAGAAIDDGRAAATLERFAAVSQEQANATS